jgi:MoaA/NifB/PqqE/SkfB family radical SAM enzyme
MQEPEKQLKMVHLQLTQECNLRCHFCGQWGDKGFLRKLRTENLTVGEWKQVINDLVDYRRASGVRPAIVLWGGEPLLYPSFREIVKYLRNHGFDLGIVTNGVLLNQHSELIRNEFSTVYVSIDGPEEIHDSIRGKGVFKKVVAGIREIKGGKPKLVSMTTICPENVAILPDLPYLFEHCGADKILLHELICLDPEEITTYKNWMYSAFGIKAGKIDSWQMKLPLGYGSRKKNKLKEMFQRLAVTPVNVPIEYLSHGDEVKTDYCLSPFYHLHVASDGSVLFCTDFYDFSNGNVRKEKLIDIWNGDSAERFRQEIMQGNCPTCKHCAWKGNGNYVLD